MSGRRHIQPGDLADEIGKATPFDHPAQEAYLNLVRTRSVLSEHFARPLREHGLTESQYNLLRIVESAGAEGIRTEDIRERLVERGPDVTRLVDRLEGRGLIRRTTDPGDRRVRRIQVETEGVRLLEAIRPKLDRIHDQHLSHLSDADLAALNRLLFLARHPDS
ncbi:MAG: MarR family transcriptional regulator [Phycisphaera sp.]|nr:MarR family transcriptional regulator [Phycisphaera sp.]